jgi:site-specific DNA recombinase
MRAVAKLAEGNRAILYLRQSTHNEESISLEVQEAAGREYCRQRGYQVTAVLSDPGISGRTWNRPAVKQAMEMIDHHTADVIVLWKWSRLSRARLDWAVAVDRVEQAGGRIESATEPMDTSTSAGRLARGMLAEFAAFESERIGDTWKEAHQRRRLRGLPPTGKDRWGYVRDGQEYTPDPVTGEALRDLYMRHIAGEGFGRLAKHLNTHGHSTQTGIPWTHDKIRQVLDSGFAAGQIIQGRYPNARYYPGAQSAIIDPETWATYLDVRGQAKRPARVVEPKYWLTGLVTCGDCGGPMRSHQRNGQPGLACSNYLSQRGGRLVTAKRATLEAYVWGELQTIAAEVDARAALKLASTQQQAIALNDTAAISARIEAIDDQMTSITLGWSAGKVPQVAYERSIAKLQAQRDELSTRERRSNRTAAQHLRAREVAADLVAQWEKYTVLEKRQLLAELIETVRVIPPAVKKQGGAGPVTFEMVWQFPT